jgi:hypothetical protein
MISPRARTQNTRTAELRPRIDSRNPIATGFARRFALSASLALQRLGFPGCRRRRLADSLRLTIVLLFIVPRERNSLLCW